MGPVNVRIRGAHADEGPLLTAIALRSKGHWGYDTAFLEACREELTVRDAELDLRRTRVVEVEGAAVGFSTLEGEAPVGVLGMLFVEPDRIGRGLGRALMIDLVERARAAGFVRLVIDSDPSAEPFYLAQGAVRVGETPSGSIPGRVLPQLALDLDERPH